MIGQVLEIGDAGDVRTLAGFELDRQLLLDDLVGNVVEDHVDVRIVLHEAIQQVLDDLALDAVGIPHHPHVAGKCAAGCTAGPPPGARDYRFHLMVFSSLHTVAVRLIVETGRPRPRARWIRSPVASLVSSSVEPRHFPSLQVSTRPADRPFVASESTCAPPPRPRRLRGNAPSPYSGSSTCRRRRRRRRDRQAAENRAAKASQRTVRRAMSAQPHDPASPSARHAQFIAGGRAAGDQFEARASALSITKPVAASGERDVAFDARLRRTRCAETRHG